MAQQHATGILRLIGNVFACCLIIAGLFFLYVPTQTVSSDAFFVTDSFSGGLSNVTIADNGPIQKLNIPVLGLDLIVKPGSYNTNDRTWTIDQYNVFSAENTKTPLIYGHNTQEVFGDLSKLTLDDVLLVTHTDNHKAGYRLVERGIVSPEDASILDYYKPGIIHLMTCTGNRDELREILRFELI